MEGDQADAGEERRKRRRSRWGPSVDEGGGPGERAFSYPPPGDFFLLSIRTGDLPYSSQPLPPAYQRRLCRAGMPTNEKPSRD